MKMLNFASDDQRRSAFSYEVARQKMEEGDNEVATLWQKHAASWAEDARTRLFAILNHRKSDKRRSDLSE